MNAGLAFDNTAPDLSQASLSRPLLAEVNLNQAAQAWRAEHADLWVGKKNPLLIPENCQAMVNELHSRLGCPTWGGYLENRSELWAGSYLEKKNAFIHAGIDVNLPAGTEVRTTQPSRVLRVDNDYPEKHGWGVRVIMEPLVQIGEPVVIIYAHLQKVSCGVGAVIGAGDSFAEIGDWAVTEHEGRKAWNGWWFQHLHIQAASLPYYEQSLTSGIKALDGYFPESQLENFKAIFPNPSRFNPFR